MSACGTGYFVVLDGIDGCGKSLHSRILSRALAQRGYRAALTAEPSRGEVGAFLGRLIRDERKLSPVVETLLFTADRFDHLRNEVEPLLNKGTVVVCDRYFYSTLAYQGGQGVDRDWIRTLNRFARKPDLAFCLDVSPQLALERLRRKRSVFELPPLLEKVRGIYLELVKEYGMILVDSSRSIEEVSEKILAHTLERLGPP